MEGTEGPGWADGVSECEESTEILSACNLLRLSMR